LLSELAISHSTASLVSCESQKESFPTALKKQLNVLPEGLDLSSYNPNKTAELKFSKLEIRAGQPLVTLVSRNLEPLRGLRQALRAWPIVAKAVPEAQLLLVGDTDQGYGDEQPISHSHLNDALSVLPDDVDRSRIHHLGWLDHPTMVKLIQCSACHLALSYPYTLSWSVLEAMACGAPIITNIGSPISSDLTHKRNSLIVPFNDIEALAEAMTRLLQTPELREKLGQEGRGVIVKQFNLDITLLAYEELFSRLVSQAPEANQISN
jgi:glycosyltransferase involved in cell wall biosynthesis